MDSVISELARSVQSAGSPMSDPKTSWAICEQIEKQVRAFESRLDEEHEVAVKLTSFGESVLMSVTSIVPSGPCVVAFNGFVGDKRAVLMQNVSQLNFMLVAADRTDKSKTKVIIGFH